MAIDLNELRAHAIGIFEGLSHLSTPFIVTFVLVHLAAPASANFGGSSLASQTMVRLILFLRQSDSYTTQAFGSGILSNENL